MLFAVNSYDENSVVGCGYVSDHYLETLPNHQNLELLGVTDLKPERAQVLAKHYGLNIYDSLEAILADPSLQLFLNLTYPENHYSFNRRSANSMGDPPLERSHSTSLLSTLSSSFHQRPTFV